MCFNILVSRFISIVDSLADSCSYSLSSKKKIIKKSHSIKYKLQHERLCQEVTVTLAEIIFQACRCSCQLVACPFLLTRRQQGMAQRQAKPVLVFPLSLSAAGVSVSVALGSSAPPGTCCWSDWHSLFGF